MSGLTVLILTCLALCSGMCAQHIPWRALEAHIRAQEKAKFMLEVVGPKADVAELPSIATRIAAIKFYTHQHMTRMCLYSCASCCLGPSWLPGHSCAPRVCLHNSLPHQSKFRKRPRRAP